LSIVGLAQLKQNQTVHHAVDRLHTKERKLTAKGKIISKLTFYSEIMNKYMVLPEKKTA
jgi:hypothetical protein